MEPTRALTIVGGCIRLTRPLTPTPTGIMSRYAMQPHNTCTLRSEQGTYPDGTTCTSPSCPSPQAPYYPNTPTCFRGCCPSGVTCESIIPACSGTYANGYTSITASTTTSNGQGGNGADVASGLALNTGGCACGSLGCELSFAMQTGVNGYC